MTGQEGGEVEAALVESSRTASVALGMSAAHAAALVRRLRDGRVRAERAGRLASARSGADQALADAGDEVARLAHIDALATASFPSPLPLSPGGRRGEPRDTTGRARRPVKAVDEGLRHDGATSAMWAGR